VTSDAELSTSEARFEALSVAVQTMTTQEWAGYRSEVDSWDAANLDGLPSDKW
jgi:hypothetical protein